MKSWCIVNEHDANDRFIVEAETKQKAYLEALSKLGWDVFGPYPRRDDEVLL